MKRCSRKFSDAGPRGEIQNSPDTQLIDFVRQEDVSAFEELMQRYQCSVWGVAYRTLGNYQDCQDAVQETFFRAYPLGLLGVGGGCLDVLHNEVVAWVVDPRLDSGY